MCILYLYGCGLGTLHVATKCTLDTNNSVFWTLTFSVPWILFIKVYWRHQFWCPYWDKPRTPDLVSGGHYFFTVHVVRTNTYLVLHAVGLSSASTCIHICVVSTSYVASYYSYMLISYIASYSQLAMYRIAT